MTAQRPQGPGRSRGGDDYVALIHPRSRAVLLLAVFFLFAPMWLIAVSRYAWRQADGSPVDAGGIAGMVVWAVLGGLTAMFWVLGFTVSKRWIVPAVVLNIFLPVGGVLSAWAHDVHGFWLYPGVASPVPGLEGMLLVASLIAGYVCFNYFINTEGRRRIVLETEVSLARDIHRALVPAIDHAQHGWRIAGVSRASGSMGGDLIDVFDSGPDAVDAVLLDVSGHGVKAGVVMALLKGAARAARRTRTEATAGQAASAVSSVLHDSTEPGLFATGVWLTLNAQGRASFVIAGHPPAFIVRAGGVERLGDGGLSLGVLRETSYDTSQVMVGSGEALVLYTDGLTEARRVTDNTMIGIAGVEALVRESVAQHAQAGPAQVAADVLARVDALTGGSTDHDDMTVLVIRRD